MNVKYAGFWIRFAAHLIDFILLNAVEVALEYAISLPLGLGAVTQQVIGVILSFALCYVYYVEVPMRRGTTLGKQVFGIYVLDASTGLNFTKKQAIGRMFAYLLSYAIVGCGFLMAAFHPQKRGLHDLIAGTVSVRRKKGERLFAQDSAPLADPTGSISAVTNDAPSSEIVRLVPPADST